MARDVYVIRHGSTGMNAKNLIRGHSNPALSAEGRKEVEELAKRLKGTNIAVLFHSDLSRAADTAKAVAEATGADLFPTKLLRPWDLGELTGRLCDEVQSTIDDYAENRRNTPVKGGESFNDFMYRARAGVRLALGDSRPVAIVSHHRVERLIEAEGLYGDPDFEVFSQEGEKPAHAERVSVDLSRVVGARGARLTGTDVTGPAKVDWDGKRS